MSLSCCVGNHEYQFRGVVSALSKISNGPFLQKLTAKMPDKSKRSSIIDAWLVSNCTSVIVIINLVRWEIIYGKIVISQIYILPKYLK